MRYQIPYYETTLEETTDRLDPELSLLLEPLFEMESPSLISRQHSVRIDGVRFELPRFLFLGESGGGVPIRVGVFAGLDAASVETVAATARLLIQFHLCPSLARDFAVFAYPIVNAPGFTRQRASQEALRRRWATNPRAEDARFFREEVRDLSHNLIIQYRTTTAHRKLTATTRSRVLAAEVLAPALRVLATHLPVGPESVQILATNTRSPYASIMEDQPAKPSGPTTIELFAPAEVEPQYQTAALFFGTVQILQYYRGFIAQGGEI